METRLEGGNENKITQGSVGHVKEFGLYSECTGKSLKGFRKANDKPGGTVHLKKNHGYTHEYS